MSEEYGREPKEEHPKYPPRRQPTWEERQRDSFVTNHMSAYPSHKAGIYSIADQLYPSKAKQV